jgi:hypothetical protein
MKGKVVLFLTLALILFFFASLLSADTIILQSEKVVEGKITEETDEFIAVETESGTSFFRKEEIKSITKTRLDAATGSVAEVTGAVDVLPKGETQWMPLREGEVLNEGDSIRTGTGSKAIATLADQVVMAVEPESSVDLEKLQRSERRDIDIKMNLARGQIWTDVGKLRTKGSRFYVTSPAVVTGVRGTIFTVQAGPEEKTTVAVVDGAVEVRTRNMIMSPVRVKENQMTEVTPNNPPTKPMAISAGFLAQWALLQAKFGLLRGGLSQGFQISPAQAAAGGGAVAAGAAVAVAASPGGGGGGGGTVVVTKSLTGAYDPNPVDTEIDGTAAIGGRTVTSVDVKMLCDPFTVPDQFQIVYMGNVIGDTGMIGEDLGDPGEDILLTASANGSSPIVTIRVISGAMGTDWHWDARVIYHVK